MREREQGILSTLGSIVILSWCQSKMQRALSFVLKNRNWISEQDTDLKRLVAGYIVVEVTAISTVDSPSF